MSESAIIDPQGLPALMSDCNFVLVNYNNKLCNLVKGRVVGLGLDSTNSSWYKISLLTLIIIMIMINFSVLI